MMYKTFLFHLLLVALPSSTLSSNYDGPGGPDVDFLSMNGDAIDPIIDAIGRELLAAIYPPSLSEEFELLQEYLAAEVENFVLLVTIRLCNPNPCLNGGICGMKPIDFWLGGDLIDHVRRNLELALHNFASSILNVRVEDIQEADEKYVGYGLQFLTRLSTREELREVSIPNELKTRLNKFAEEAEILEPKFLALVITSMYTSGEFREDVSEAPTLCECPDYFYGLHCENCQLNGES